MGAFLVGLFGSLAGFFGQWMTKKLAAGSAAVGVMIGLGVVFWSVVNGLIAGIVYSYPSLCELGYAIPSNTAACIGAVMSAMVARWVYSEAAEKVRLLTYVS